MAFIIIFFSLWRLGLFFIAWVGEKILSFNPRFPYSDIYLVRSGLPHWAWSFGNFDGVHYLTIATHGYSAQFTQVFFPLYPLFISLVHTLLNINPVIIGFLISNTFFLLSLFVFRKLLLLDFKKNTVKWSLIFLAAFPTSFYFGSIYTESLFMFLVFSAFLAGRKKQWFLAAVLGALASATRLTGIFLLPALGWELLSDSFHPRGVFKALRLPLALIPVGLLSYMLYLQMKFGDWLYFWHAQPVFGAQRAGSAIILLPQVLWRYFKILTSVSFLSETFFISAVELASTAGAILLLIVGYFKKIKPSYLIFAFLSVFIPPLTGTFSSMPRYILVAFPIFIVLGMLKSRLIKGALLAVFAVLLFILTILFTNGHWVS